MQKIERYVPAGVPLTDAAWDTVLMQNLARACMTKRGHGSVSEAQYVLHLRRLLPVTMIDGAGNLHIDARTAGQRTLFTAHSDTVSRGEGRNAVLVDSTTEPGQVYWRGNGATLGSDDGAGIALMTHLLHHKVPGYYIVFRGEEGGGIGSRWLADNMPELLTEFDRAIAFDRAGYSDVITHQTGGRCCSDQFAQALADQLSTGNLMYMPDSSGVYTDTAEFIDLIPECTNLSVGYRYQHSDREWLNVTFLQELALELLKVDWENLPTARDPHAVVLTAADGVFAALRLAVESQNFVALAHIYPDSGFTEELLARALEVGAMHGERAAEDMLDQAYAEVPLTEEQERQLDRDVFDSFH